MYCGHLFISLDSNLGAPEKSLRRPLNILFTTIAGLQFFVKDVHNLLTSDPTAPLPPASCIQVLENTGADHISTVLKVFVKYHICELDALVKKIIETQKLLSFAKLPLTDKEFEEIVYNSDYLANYMRWLLTRNSETGPSNIFDIKAVNMLVEKVFTTAVWNNHDALLNEMDYILNRAKS